jgi:hypothetical protein
MGDVGKRDGSDAQQAALGFEPSRKALLRGWWTPATTMDAPEGAIEHR